MVTKKELTKKLRAAKQRVLKEDRKVINAQARKRYWQAKVSNLRYRLGLAESGQLEMDFN